MSSMAASGLNDDATRSGQDRASSHRVPIGRLALDAVSLDQAVAWTIGYVRHRGSRPPARLSCPNASLVVLADQDARFADIVNASELVVADGKPLLWAAAVFGTPLDGQVRGVDLMERLCAAGAGFGMSVYILGALPGAAELAAKRLVRNHLGIRLAGIDCPEPGFDLDAAANRRVRDRIVAAAPDLLLVALGSPKQEWWIYRNYLDLPVGAVLGVGGAVDTYAGLRAMPPQWMRELGLEWLGRLLREPRRLWRRYLFGNARFVVILLRQWSGMVLSGFRR